jgi:shikimate dehydrogenase
LDVSGCDVLINATPAGLEAGDSFPVPLEGLRVETLVADIASLSRETELLATARQRGCAVFDGMAMLRAQIELVAAFILGLPEATPISSAGPQHGAG